MAKYNILKTMEDKAGFIADNMEMEYDGIDFDEVILFYYRLDKTIYGVTDFYGHNSSFFESYYEAENYFADMCEDVREYFDDNCEDLRKYFGEYIIDEFSTIKLTKNHILFEGTIRGDTIDVPTLEDLFNTHIYDEVELQRQWRYGKEDDKEGE